jgi:hypothetical protein
LLGVEPIRQGRAFSPDLPAFFFLAAGPLLRAGEAGGGTIGGLLGEAKLAQAGRFFTHALRVYLELRHCLGSRFLTLLLEEIGHCRSSFGAATLRNSQGAAGASDRMLRGANSGDHAFTAAQSRGGCAAVPY